MKKDFKYIVVIALFVSLAPGLALAQTKGDAKAGKAKYDANCVGCHGSGGKGDGPAAAALNPKPGDFTNGKAMKSLSDKFLFDIIKEGGASQKKSPIMTAFGKKLNDKDISDIVAYIRSLAK
jgi:mono/diheme cytochrome c family protein